MKSMKEHVGSRWSRFKHWLKAIVYPEDESCKDVSEDAAVDFDTAIAATGFGRYNLMLMLFAIPAAVASIYDTTTMSYVIPSAECDLQLSIIDKGILNGVTHLGMISCCFISGYLTDTLGRRNTLIFGYLLDAVVNLIGSFSQNFAMLATMKFFSGFLMCGPCTVIFSCLTEFFSASFRPMFTMYMGLCFALGSFSMPFVAWLFLENPRNFVVGSTFVIHSWQVFMACCCVPSLISGLISIFLPESPRFLLSRGRKDEALQILKRVYAANKGCSPDEYPVKELKIVRDDGELEEKVDEANVETEGKGEAKDKEGALAALTGGLRQLRPLFLPPHLWHILLTIALEFGCTTGANTLRLWLPQLFKMMSESAEEQLTLCEMIVVNKTAASNGSLIDPEFCEPIKIRSEAYINSAIVAGMQVIFCVFSGFAINAMGKKPLLFFLLSISGVCSFAMYFCTNAQQATFLAAIAVAFNNVGSTTTMSVLVDLFPTSLRATAASITLMSGRIGSIIGNLTFPILLTFGCLPPFLALAIMLIGCCLLSTTIPKPKAGIT